ncbi:hypothetical protein [Bradyrhizobium sp. USDA 4486]
MPQGSILLVHGTGVRLGNYEKSFEVAVKTASECSLGRNLFPCAWGDPLGVEFEGLSLPDVPTAEVERKAEEDLAQWIWILDDPLVELSLLAIPDGSAAKAGVLNPEGPTPAEQNLEQVRAYAPSLEFRQLLARGGLEDVWEPARTRILSDKVTERAFEASEHEPQEAFRALARALVAQLHVEAVSRSRPALSAVHREKLVQRLLIDWKQQVFGISDRFLNFVARAGTRYVRDRRNALNAVAALPLGDVLLYQTNGAKIRSFIKSKIESCPAPVTIVAHSLGGIACVDLLALGDIPKVDGLVTLGSQSSFMHEIGSLSSLKAGEKLREGFPRWLNVFDRNDFLSFFASRIFPNAIDFEVASGQPFPESHSAYFGNEVVWTRIRSFIAGQE